MSCVLSIYLNFYVNIFLINSNYLKATCESIYENRNDRQDLL